MGNEIVAEAVEDAKRNAKRNCIENVDFLQGATEDVIPVLYEKGLQADVVVLDPPRKGCDERLLNTILKIAPKKIVYVSCDPATMARDIKTFIEQGYCLNMVQPVDMFPHTIHVEAIVLLQKAESLQDIVKNE